MAKRYPPKLKFQNGAGGIEQRKDVGPNSEGIRSPSQLAQCLEASLSGEGAGGLCPGWNHCSTSGQVSSLL
jgi:hypothetical protein